MGKKQKLLAQDQADQMPLSRAQVIMRDDMLRSKDAEGRPNFIDPQVPLFDDELDDETPEQHDGPQPPRVYGTGKCPECGEDLFALQVRRGTFSWFHNRFGSHSPQDQHIQSFAGVQRTDRMHTIGQALDEVVGKAPQLDRDKAVADLALSVIHAGPSLDLSLAQWQRVQALVEMGVRAGSDAEQSGRL